MPDLSNSSNSICSRFLPVQRMISSGLLRKTRVSRSSLVVKGTGLHRLAGRHGEGGKEGVSLGVGRAPHRRRAGDARAGGDGGYCPAQAGSDSLPVGVRPEVASGVSALAGGAAGGAT